MAVRWVSREDSCGKASRLLPGDPGQAGVSSGKPGFPPCAPLKLRPLRLLLWLPLVDKSGLRRNHCKNKCLSPHCVPLPVLQLQGSRRQWVMSEQTQPFQWPLWPLQG